uniref:Uncharacterized protein n=2 Tax=Clastoptera arizonana TaxID=38151 RepID=A0A1B6DW04_9HEMI
MASAKSNDELQIISLSKKLSSSRLNRTLSQMEINELVIILRDCRVNYIAVLKVMLMYISETKKYKLMILEATEHFNGYLSVLKQLESIMQQMEMGMSEVPEDPQIATRIYVNENYLLAMTIPKLQEKKEIVFKELENKLKYIIALQDPVVMQHLEKITFFDQMFSEAKANCAQQLLEQKTENANILLEIKNEELSRNECEFLITEENLQLNAIRYKLGVVSEGIEKLKTKLAKKLNVFGDIDILKNYFQAESNRKSLAYQKRWLLFLLNNSQQKQKNKNERIVFKYGKNRFNSHGMWRVGGLVIFAIFRLKYLLRVRTRFHAFEVNQLKKVLMNTK